MVSRVPVFCEVDASTSDDGRSRGVVSRGIAHWRIGSRGRDHSISLSGPTSPGSSRATADVRACGGTGDGAVAFAHVCRLTGHTHLTCSSALPRQPARGVLVAAVRARTKRSRPGMGRPRAGGERPGCLSPCHAPPYPPCSAGRRGRRVHSVRERICAVGVPDDSARADASRGVVARGKI